MKTYLLRYCTAPSNLHRFNADEITYSGGDSVVVVAFHVAKKLVGIAALQPGMVVVEE